MMTVAKFWSNTSSEIRIGKTRGRARNWATTFGGAAAFTPADLFASAEAGFWYDPSDLSTLWKDTAGTTPVTADGDLVARIDDKTGNGNNATQASSSLRPVYKTAGGLHWLQFDGVDDWMQIPIMADFAGSAARSAYYAGTNPMLSLGNNQANFQRWTFRKDVSLDKLRIEIQGAGYSSSLVAAALGVNAITLSGTTLATHVLRRNGSTESATGTSTVNTSQTETNPVINTELNTLGSREQVDVQYAATNFYGGLLIDRVLSSGELSNADTYFGDKVGVTL